MRSDADLIKSFRNKIDRIQRATNPEPYKPKVVPAKSLKEAVDSMELLSVEAFKEIMTQTGQADKIQGMTDLEFKGIQLGEVLSAFYEVTLADKSKVVACVDWDHDEHTEGL
jgi:hypothetical protein